MTQRTGVFWFIPWKHHPSERGPAPRCTETLLQAAAVVSERANGILNWHRTEMHIPKGAHPDCGDTRQ